MGRPARRRPVSLRASCDCVCLIGLRDVVQRDFPGGALRFESRMRGERAGEPWLTGILRHKIVDQIRKSGRESARLNGVCSKNGANAEAEAFISRGHWRAGPASWAGNPGRRDGDERVLGGVRQFASKLPQRLADAFFLRELDGLERVKFKTPWESRPRISGSACIRARIPAAPSVSGRAGSARGQRSPSVKGRSNSPGRLKECWQLLNLPCEGMSRLASQSLEPRPDPHRAGGPSAAYVLLRSLPPLPARLASKLVSRVRGLSGRLRNRRAPGRRACRTMSAKR